MSKKTSFLITVILCCLCLLISGVRDCVPQNAVEVGSSDNILIIEIWNICVWCGIPFVTISVIHIPWFLPRIWPLEITTVPENIVKGDKGRAVFTFDVASDLGLRGKSDGELTGSLVFHISSGSGYDTTQTVELVVSAEQILSAETGYGIPGMISQAVNMDLENEADVSFVHFTLNYVGDLMEVSEISPTSRTSGMKLSWEEIEPGKTRVSMAAPEIIGPGEGPIAQCYFNVYQATTPGESIFVTLSDVFLQDPEVSPLSVGLKSGQFLFGKKGEVNGDGAINVLDLLTVVNIILEIHVPTGYQLWAADCNGDGVINVLDVLGIVRVILGLGPCSSLAPPLKGTFVQTQVTVSNPLVHTRGEVLIPIDVRATQPAAGFQLRMSYDASKLVPGKPQSTPRSAAMTLASQAQSGAITLLLYGQRGERIPVGAGPVVVLPFRILDGVRGDAGLEFEDILVAGLDCASMPVEVPYPDISLDLGLPLPTVYSLAQNYPNPFNLQTVIEYQLPREGRVVLTVYNIVGQEVCTLTDEVKEAGYYTIRWDGRDTSGVSVASGLYFYRLQAGTFRQTMKMLLLK
ncbi:MAG: T9SS type A sorting domain-containing protein [Gemmatimonadota bacterium]|nr:MAG: T9SS type A sorting domain-containing protein [Gemmatimonadota bacterium]